MGTELQQFRLKGIQEIDKSLGNGSYATVVEMRFRGLKCAGKKIHSLLYNESSAQEKRHMLQTFAEECQLLARLSHPNIVQFIGVHVQRDTLLPTLVMEFLYCTLSQCLGRCGALPEKTALPILSDVATGLSYLHGHRPPVVHRDLSANNVLLTTDMKAKVSDLGMAKILNLTPAMMSQMTKCPGTPSYMPPEALRANPAYDTSIDCFSMGVMMVHVLSGRWPIPSEPNRVSPDDPDQLIALNEAQRREEYLQLIRSDPPLMELIQHCLKNNPSQRPNAEGILSQLQQAVSRLPPPPAENKLESVVLTKALRSEKQGLSEQLEELQRAQERMELAHSIETEQVNCRLVELSTEANGLRSQVRVKEMELETNKSSLNKVIQAKQQEIQAKEQEMHTKIQAKEQEMHTKILAKEQEIRAKEQKIQAMEHELQAKEELKQCEMIVKEKEIEQRSHLLAVKNTSIEKLTDQVKKLQQHNTQPHLLSAQYQLSWSPCADLPEAPKLPQSIVIGNVVFVQPLMIDENHLDIHQYSINDNEWSILPRPMVDGFGLGQLSGKLITVGGESEEIAVGNVYQFNEGNQQWEESAIPPMPTPRALPCVITHQSNVAACGGGNEEEASAAVEVFMSSTSQWHRAAPLPIPCAVTQHTVMQDTCYLGGMVTGFEKPQQGVFSASLSQIFQTLPCDQQPSALHTWTSLPDQPYVGSALANMGGTLLAIGGGDEQTETEEDQEKETTAVHAYCPSTSSWVQVGTTPLPCILSTAQLLPSGQLILIGGFGSKKVHIGTLKLQS